MLKFLQSRRTHPNSRTTNRASRSSPASPSSGIKRKGKPDPYDDLDYEQHDNVNDDGDDEDANNENEVIPAQNTPATQRTAQPHISSNSPRLSRSARVSLPSNKRLRSRQSSPNPLPDGTRGATSSRAGVEGSSDGSNALATIGAQPVSLVPEAPMGDLELGSADVAGAEILPGPIPQAERTTQHTTRTNSKSHQPKTSPGPLVLSGQEDNDDREVHEIAELLEYRMSGGRSGAVELLVQWKGEAREDATWEAEAEIQQGAEEMLYEFWRAQGGRISALFHKPRNPPPELYYVFKVLRHERSRRGGFQFEVQWVGHPRTQGETTMETEAKLKSIAPQLLEEYWKSVGGRKSHLTKRGGAKKTRAT
ncbi:hypothetical protein GGS20DRAFT_567127 [Poronia punctata]|nr:hypothetical protein GGS20DRAFT_567127 [Poronia punctata]